MTVELAPGDIFAGEYRVLRHLRGGGMGAVYVVEQLSTGAQRALKLMHPQLAKDAGMRRRFETEARVGSLIDSDHVVQVVGAGIDRASGVPWLAMELWWERISRSTRGASARSTSPKCERSSSSSVTPSARRTKRASSTVT